MAQGAGFRDEYDLECAIELFSEENAEGCDVAGTFILSGVPMSSVIS